MMNLYGFLNKSKKGWAYLTEQLVYVFGIAGAVLTIPQIYKIFVWQTAAGLSLISWISYFVISLFWLSYGIFHKNKVFIVMYLANIAVQGLVIAGIFLYA